MKIIASLLMLASMPIAGQDSKPGPTLHYPVVEIKGTVKQIHLERGAGMPSLDVETTNGPVRLVLGSMRYLMQNDFSPKAGEAITAKAFQQPSQTLAMSVELPASGKSLKLRDASGKPLWSGGAMKGAAGGYGRGKGGGKGGGKA
jgi:hypothetical protein